MINKTQKKSPQPDNIENSRGAVLLTVVFVLIIIGLVGSAIYSLTFTSIYTQMNAQNTTRAQYIADSGVRIVAAEYNQAADTNKNTTLESLHSETLTLPGNNGQIDLWIYPYWFYVNSVYTSNSGSISLRMPGGFPVTDMQDPTAIAPLPQTGRLKVQGKTSRATFTNSNRAGNIATFTLGSDKFPFDIQPDEELFLVYHDNTTLSQNIAQEGDNLLLASTNQVAQFIPDEKGAFRVHNEDNDRMDYTYHTKVSSGGNIQLTGIRSQDPANPSIFPFSVDSASEIFFGKNLATVATTALGQGLFAGQKTVVTYSDVGLDGGFNIGRDNISFEEDIEDFNYPGLPMNNPDPGSGDKPIEVDEGAKEINLGGGLNDGYGSVWYGGDSDTANCIDGRCNLGKGFRAYFEFVPSPTMKDTSSNSTDYGDGFTFAVISGVYDPGPGTYRNSKYDTGGPLGEYLGYAGPGLSFAEGGDEDGLKSPKIALEMDTFPDPGAGSICPPNTNSRNDDIPIANHIALDYWGVGSPTEKPGSFLAISTSNDFVDGGGFLRIQDDWSSAAGTISFWFKRNTLRSSDRLWGQNANMEMRFSGADLVIDWGVDEALIIPNHPFTLADTWYFMAIAWDETIDALNVYYGTESTAISPLVGVPKTFTVSTMGSTGNYFFNSSGGDGLKNYIVDGNGSDLRYYNTERSQADIESDYYTRLSGTESNLQAYFPLQVDVLDAGPAGVLIIAEGTTSWSLDTPMAFECGTEAATLTYDDNRHGAGGSTTTQPMNSLNTNPGTGDDGYYQVAKGMSTYNWMEDGNCYGVRLELIRPLLPDGGVYKYQIKAWVNSVDADCTGLNANYKDVRATYTGTDPQIELTIDNGNPLELAESVHLDLKNILFGFTQATSGAATQDITLKNLDMRFIKLYPVADMTSW